MNKRHNPRYELIHAIAIDAHADEDMIERALAQGLVQDLASIDVLDVCPRPFLYERRQQRAHKCDQ